MIPLQFDDEGSASRPKNTVHPFSRGIMAFDDYNYKSHNDYVMVEEPWESEKNRIIDDRKNV